MVHLFTVFSFVSTFTFALLQGSAIASDAHPRSLIVVAHPDDEYYLAATVYRMATEHQDPVDELVITQGEGGYRYAGPSEKIYGLKLHDAKIAKLELPKIREAETKASGKILGIEHQIFLRQSDFGPSTHADEAFQKWDKKWVLGKITEQIKKGHYDFVFVLMPLPSTHGHHQAASLLALEAIEGLPEAERPVAIAAMTDKNDDHFWNADQETEAKDGRHYEMLAGFPISKIDSKSPTFRFDRHQILGNEAPLTYELIVNWMISEYKSQGMFQTFVNRDDEEHFKVFQISGDAGLKKANAFFESVGVKFRN